MKKIKWTTAKIDEIKRLYLLGKTRREIGDIFNTTGGIISNILYLHKIKRPATFQRRYFQSEYQPQGSSPFAGTEIYTPHKRITKERLDYIKSLREIKNLSFEEIAKIDGTSELYVKQLYKTAIGKIKSPSTLSSMGIKLKDIGKDRRIKISDADIEEIKILRAKGQTLNEIAKQFNVTRETIRIHLMSPEKRQARLDYISKHSLERQNELRKTNPEFLKEVWAKKEAYRRECIRALSAEQIRELKEKSNNG